MAKAADRDRTIRPPTGAILSKYLRALAVEVETTNAKGDTITKAAALAELVWKYALGFTDVKTDIPLPPAVWAIELLYNRIEGKVAAAITEDSGRTLAEKVSDLGKARANSLATAAADRENAPDEGAEDDE